MRLRQKPFAIAALVVILAFLVKAQFWHVRTSLAAQTSRSALTLPLTQAPLRGQEVFRKQLADESVLLLLQTPGVYVKRPSPTSTGIVIHPDSVDVLSLFLVSADRKMHRLLWKQNFLLYLKNPSRQKYFFPSPKYEIFDISLEANKLLILYQDGWRLLSRTVILNAPVTAQNSRPDRVIPTPTQFSVALDVLDVKTAHFTDPVVNGVPGIEATCTCGVKRHFIWRGGSWKEPNPPPNHTDRNSFPEFVKKCKKWMKRLLP